MMSSEDLPIRLEDYHISRRTGFLIDQPLRELPMQYAVWDEVAKQAAELVRCKTLRQVVDQMPLLDHRGLMGYREKRLAHLQLSVIASCYIWQEGDAGVPQSLPACISIPWWEVSRQLGLQPSVNHATFVLANWRVVEHDRLMSLDNLDWLYPLPGGESSKWFCLITVHIEKDFVPALTYIEKGLRSMRSGDKQSLTDCLHGIQRVICDIKSTFSKMHERVDPQDFYDRLRPFLSGWGGAGSPLPRGLVYAGVSEKPHQVTGGSAAQSSIFQTLDAFLGVKHTGSERKFLFDMRSYMPPDHRKFIDMIENGPSLREYVLKSNCADLKTAFEKCLGTLIDFRSYHLTIVAKYVVSMSHRMGRNQVYASVSKQGTGGSSVVPFLKSVRSTTQDAQLYDD
ncbi:indoleamine 2,3-dioxygenase 2-like [Liolophura sinensis]|uniref:indoleamine 2,3-dioxygenase 2-like n=1 Tax=Liolophura sinensis TaxID=3198878 RepID=UPI00315960E2